MLRVVALPWARLELPLWRNVLNRVAGHAHLPGLPVRRVRGKLHGYEMVLHTSDWVERWAFYLGRYYEAHTQSLFRAAVREGDVFVDIGANIGMTVLVAARLVGPRGKVVAFEPNPQVFQRLSEHLSINQLAGLVEARNLGLADAPGELVLHVPTHTGQASFAPLADEVARTGATDRRVSVRVGDEELAALPPGPMLVKIDVEGFETRVLAGLTRTLAQRRPAVCTEAVPALLERAGASMAGLFEFMHRHGYRGHSVEFTHGPVGFSGRLTLRRVDGPGPGLADDVLWLHPESEHAQRLAGLVVNATNGANAANGSNAASGG